MSDRVTEPRPLCAEAARERGDELSATASRIDHWVLVEYAGLWPFRPLDAAPFAGRLGKRLAEQLAAVPRTRLVLVKKPGRGRDERLRVVLARTRENGAEVAERELRTYSDLLELDLASSFAGPLPGEPLDHPLVLVCTHGKRDRCCARFGQPVCEALHQHAPSSWLWQASHVGGDRFAGNVVTLPEGFYFGGVTPDDVPRLLADYREGRLTLDLFRGRCAYPFPVQAAEAAVRREHGLDGFWDLRFAGSERMGANAWRIRVESEVAGAVYEVVVERTYGEPALLTCSATRANPPQRYAARSVAAV